VFQTQVYCAKISSSALSPSPFFFVFCEYIIYRVFHDL